MNEFNEFSEEPMSVGDWIITIIVTALPLIGIIMLFVWAFGGNAPSSKANWAKATLLLYVIVIVLGVLFGGALLTFIAAGNS